MALRLKAGEWEHSSLVLSPPQLLSLAVRITWRRPGENYHVIYTTIDIHTLVTKFVALYPCDQYLGNKTGIIMQQ